MIMLQRVFKNSIEIQSIGEELLKKRYRKDKKIVWHTRRNIKNDRTSYENSVFVSWIFLWHTRRNIKNDRTSYENSVFVSWIFLRKQNND
jgi:hypothetical protein